MVVESDVDDDGDAIAIPVGSTSFLVRGGRWRGRPGEDSGLDLPFLSAFLSMVE